MLVVNVNHRLRNPFAAVEPPLWAGLCASYLNADILDAEALDLTLDETEREVRFRLEMSIRQRKQPVVLIVVMGNNPSVSSTPKMAVAEALADRIADLDVCMTGIHPIAVGSKYPVIKTPFEGFPKMPWDKLPMDRYKAHNWHCLDGSSRSPYVSIYTSLGCPFDCYYCNIHTLYPSRTVQLRPEVDIVCELDHLVYKYGVRNVKFWDELFALDEKRVVSLCNEIVDYGLNIWAYARVDTVTPTMLKAMKEAGVNWLAYGFESADISTRWTVNKHYKDTQAERAIKMTRDAGINIMGNFMFGLPGESEDGMQKTLDFCFKHLFEYVNFYVARPYPGSKWYNDTKVDWHDLDQYGTNRLEFRDKAFKAYFGSQEYQDMVKAKFGAQGVSHIQEMLNVSPVQR